MGFPILDINRFLYTKLVEDATIQETFGDRVYLMRIPKNLRDVSNSLDVLDPYPCIVYNMMTGAESTGMAGRNIFSRPVYQVKGICRGNDITVIEAGMKRVAAIFEGAQQLDQLTVIGIHRTAAIMYPETDETGNEYCHLGGQYEIYAYEQ